MGDIVDATVEIRRPARRVRSVGNVTDGTGESADAVKRALRPEQGFDAGDVEKLEVLIERHFAEVDCDGTVGVGAGYPDVRRRETAHDNGTGRARTCVQNGQARRERGKTAYVVDALFG